MLLLPVSHQESTVRRLPWVSMGILLACIAMQLYTAAVQPQLERELQSLAEERLTLQSRLLDEHAAPDATRGIFAAKHAELVAKLDAGQLTSPGDARFARYIAIENDIRAVEAQLPVMRLGYKPAEGGLRSMLTSIFAHIDWVHLIGNMWFLYLVGCNLEDRWGRWQFLAFYLTAGCLAARAYGTLHQGSLQPLVGASGAVAGAMGAFMVCYARTRIKMFYAYMLLFKPRWGTFRAPTWVVLGLWLAQQLLMTFIEARAGSPVAYSAHASGFAFGAIVAFLLRQTGVDEALDRASEQAAEGTAWTAHPDYIRAADARERRDHEGARAVLLELIKQAPDHAGAHEMLLDIYFEAQAASADLYDVDASLPFLIEHYHKAKMDEALVALYRRLRRFLPAYGLTDQELLRITTAAHHRKENALVVAAVTEMMTEHPASAVLPRAMLLAAEVQGRAGAHELQRDTLQRIADTFPEHACAKLAREELGRSASPASIEA